MKRYHPTCIIRLNARNGNILRRQLKYGYEKRYNQKKYFSTYHFISYIFEDLSRLEQTLIHCRHSA